MENLFVLVETAEEVIQIQNDLDKTETISYDIETTGFDFKEDIILLIQFRINGNTYLINTRTLQDRVTRYILELLFMSNKPILAHNAKFDIKFTFEKYGILFRNIHCTMIAEYLITEAREKYPSYQELGYKYLGETVEKDTVMKFVAIKETGAELTQDMLIYGAVDVLWLDEIRKQQLELIAGKKMQKVLSLEMQLVPVVTIMECNGVMIDRDKWMGLYEIALEKSETLREEIIDAVWRFCLDEIIPHELFVDIRDFLLHMHIPFKKTKKEGKRLEVITFDTPENMVLIEQEFKERLNLASPKQVKKFLQLMGSGVDSTAEKVLVSLAKRLPIAKLLLDFRKNYKRVTTYGLDFLANVKEDGRIYAKFNQIGTTTGRFSSRKPNLQNIIKGSEYRSCFIAPEGKKIITADYSQQEFRLAGELSGEPAIIEAYQKGEDMHTATASMLSDIPLEEITEEQRNIGKTVNFAILYGSSAYGLANTLGVTTEEAEKILVKFVNGFPKLSKFQKDVQNLVWKIRYSVTPIGRRRGFRKDSFWETTQDMYKFKGSINREGFNHIVQGGSADMLKYALLMMQNDNPWEDKFKIVMTVHDEIVAEVDDDIVVEAEAFMVNAMKKAGEILMTQISTEVGTKVLPYWSK